MSSTTAARPAAPAATPAAPNPAPEGARRIRRHVDPTLITLVLSLTGTIVALQQTLIVPILPEAPHLLATTPDNASWLVTSTLLTSAVATPVVSRLADMQGKRAMMLLCLTMQVIGSVLGALGDSLAWVVAGRALQGFAAALIPVGISVMRDELPREKVGPAVALMSASLGIGSAVGLPLAGLIYAHTTWHALFWVSATLAAAMIVAILLVVPESSVRTPGRFDAVGALVLSAVLVCFLLAVSKGGDWGWTSDTTLLLFVASALLLAAWLPWELRTTTPMVDLLTAVRRPVLLTNIASILVGFSMYGNMLSTTQLLQMPKASGYGFGLDVLDAGLCMLPSGIAMVVMSPVAARVTKRYGGRTSLILGALVLAGAYIVRVFLTGEVWEIMLGATLVSCGTGIAYAAMPTLIMGAVPITETASANGLNSLLRAVGTSTSSAVVAAVLTNAVMHVGGVTLPTLDAFKDIFWLCAGAALLASLVAAFVPARSRTVEERPVRTDEVGEELAEVVARGRVTAAGGEAVHHAVVTFFDAEGRQVDWSRVEPDGLFAIVVPGPGQYLAATAAVGYAPHAQLVDVDGTSALGIDLGERVATGGDTDRRIRERLAELGIADAAAPGRATGLVGTATAAAAARTVGLHGKVSGQGGTAVAGARVTLADSGGLEVARTTSAAGGIFCLPTDRQGAHLLVVDADGFAPSAASVRLTGEPVRRDVALGGTAGVRGRVVRRGTGGPGDAVPGSVVSLTDSTGAVVRTMRCGTDGAFALHGLVPGRYVLAAQGAHRPLAQPVELTGDVVVDADVVLPATSAVTGTVLDADGPVSGALVTLTDGEGDVVATMTTDALGRYSLGDVEQGRYVLTAAGHAPVARTVDVPAGGLPATATVLLGDD